MRNILLLGAALATSALISWGAPLTPEAALERVGSSAEGMRKSLNVVNPELRFTKSIENAPALYVFSTGETGYLVVAADDTTVPLLGYSDSSTLPATEDELPDAMRYWLGTLAEQVAYNREHTTGLHFRAPKSRCDIAPLVKTKWNQSAPYNDMCPLVNGTRCVTGCVATAMAQVLKFYEYPEKGTGSYYYSWNGTKLEFDYGNTTFDWINMTDTYADNSSAIEKNAVATLMYACGVGVEMSYGTGASGAVSREMGTALIRNFGYDKGLRYLGRDYFTLDEWEDLVYDNLATCGPVLYDGRNSSAGHQFICDGYQGGYYHFNWGWGGLSDGYYLLTALDPGSQGIGGSTAGYNLNQDILTHLTHDGTNPDYYIQMCGDRAFTVAETEVNLGSRISVDFSIYNYSYTALTDLQVGVMIIPTDGGQSYFVEGFSYPYELDTLYGFSDASCYITIPVGLEEGTYIIKPAFRLGSNGDPTPVMIPISKTRQYTMTVANGKASFAAEAPATIRCEEIELESDLYIGSDFKLKMSLVNNSETAEYQGTITVGLLKNNSLVAIGDALSVVLTPGETKEQGYISGFTTGSSSLTAGSYQLVVLQENEEDYSVISDRMDVTLHAKSNYSISIEDLSIEDGQIRTDMTATATLKCNSGYFAGSLTLYLFPYVSGQVTSVAAYDSGFLAVSATGNSGAPAEKAAAIGSTPVIWKFSFDNGTPGGKYFASVNNNGSWVSNQAVFTLSEKEGTWIEIPEADNPVVEKEYITLTGVTVRGGNPSRGLYILRETHADGSVTTRRVMVK